MTISQGITSCTRLFADDMKVSRVLRDTKEDVEELGRKILLQGHPTGNFEKKDLKTTAKRE